MSSIDTAKLLYRRLDAVFGRLRSRRPEAKLLEAFLDEGFASLHAGLRLRAGLLYAERGDKFVLIRRVGDPGSGPVAAALSQAQAPVAAIMRHRVYLFGDPDAVDAPPRWGLLPPMATAGLVAGSRPRRFLLLFVLADGWQPDELDFALNTVRVALEARLTDARVRVSVREAAEIQRSLLVEEPPTFPGFDIACRSIAAEEVGGDFYDFVDFGGEVLGFAIGDAAGHGLSAALLVRDVVTGLRMGIEKELKITQVFEKLNRVIHRSRLSSRFVSVFYGELETNGTLVYVNAGHQPPLLFRRGADGSPVDEVELSVGGTVIGPLVEARFRRGFVTFGPRDVLVLCTDGILERRNPAGEFFDIERLRATVHAVLAAPARVILDRLFEAALTFGDGRPWEDDATIVVVTGEAGGPAVPDAAP